MTMRPLVFAIVALLLLAAPGQAQSRHQLTLEASVFRGAAGFALPLSPTVHLGTEIGFGFPQIDRTLLPSGSRWHGPPDFEEYLHAAVLIRHRLNERISYDVGTRASIVDLWACTASDCLPATFVGAYLQPMWGGSRWSIGPRLVAGWTAESEDGGDPTFTLSLAPLNVRLTL